VAVTVPAFVNVSPFPKAPEPYIPFVPEVDVIETAFVRELPNEADVPLILEPPVSCTAPKANVEAPRTASRSRVSDEMRSVAFAESRSTVPVSPKVPLSVMVYGLPVTVIRVVSPEAGTPTVQLGAEVQDPLVAFIHTCPQPETARPAVTATRIPRRKTLVFGIPVETETDILITEAIGVVIWTKRQAICIIFTMHYG
jgi:hypothetical protein